MCIKGFLLVTVLVGAYSCVRSGVYELICVFLQVRSSYRAGEFYIESMIHADRKSAASGNEERTWA